MDDHGHMYCVVEEEHDEKQSWSAAMRRSLNRRVAVAMEGPHSYPAKRGPVEIIAGCWNFFR
jgi:hypothetical protein